MTNVKAYAKEFADRNRRDARILFVASLLMLLLGVLDLLVLLTGGMYFLAWLLALFFGWVGWSFLRIARKIDLALEEYA